ncbi:MAG: sce7726 family protein [Candidatus Margulisbacteria bacterium]|nr:sce7726 family protein [Candidatus Margulisiibacteriota bacterium]
MNDSEIRNTFHQKHLRHQHAHKDTIIIEELGLNHGKNRADIAVLNGRFIGYEIKSDNDSLHRLEDQIKSYNTIFDKAYIVVGDRYSRIIHNDIPPWWGIITALKNKDDIEFNISRDAQMNKFVKPVSIARLLWRNEVLEILEQKQACSNIRKQSREILYHHLIDALNISELRKAVKYFMRKRINWRYPKRLLQDDDLSPRLPITCDSEF